MKSIHYELALRYSKQTLKDRMALTPVTRLRILKKEQDKGAHFHHYYST